MTGHGTRFGRHKQDVIAALLTHRHIEEAASAVGISAKTHLRWMKEPEFDAAYRKARRAAFSQSVARLQIGIRCRRLDPAENHCGIETTGLHTRKGRL